MKKAPDTSQDAVRLNNALRGLMSYSRCLQNESLKTEFNAIVNGFGKERRKLFVEAWQEQLDESRHHYVLFEQMLQPAASAGLRAHDKNPNALLILQDSERALGLLEMQDHNLPIMTGISPTNAPRESEQNFVNRMRSSPDTVSVSEYLRLVHDVMLPALRHEVNLFRRNQPQIAQAYEALAEEAWQVEKRPHYLKAAADVENDPAALAQVKQEAFRLALVMQPDGFPAYSERKITQEEWDKAVRLDVLDEQKAHGRINRQQHGDHGRSH